MLSYLHGSVSKLKQMMSFYPGLCIRCLKLLKCFKVLFWLAIKENRGRGQETKWGRKILRFAETSGQWTTQLCMAHRVRISIQTVKHILGIMNRGRVSMSGVKWKFSNKILLTWDERMAWQKIQWSYYKLSSWRKHLLKQNARWTQMI